MIPPLLERKPDGGLRVNAHKGQRRVLESKKRFVFAIAGSQGGKTELAPIWLYEEMKNCGDGDYLVVSPTYPIQQKKVLPTFLKVYHDMMKLGEYRYSDRIYYVKAHGLDCKIFFSSADNPESLESATAKAAYLDEVGMSGFKLQSWEAVLRRLGIHQGRVLGCTCYDEQTEIYTLGGWKLLGDLTDTDKVYAPNQLGEGKFEKPYARTWELYRGKMLKFKGGRIDLCVTPNHRILYKNCSGYYIKSAEDFKKLSRRGLMIPKIISPDIVLKKEFCLPAINKGHRWGDNIIKTKPIKIPMSDWCAFMGWFLSEGHATGVNGGSTKNGKYHVVISQNKGFNYQLIKEDLKKLPFHWWEEKHTISTSNKQLWSYLKDFGNCYHKAIPTELKYSGKSNLIILIDRMIRGDGTYKRKSGFAYYTVSQKLANDFREICMLAGISTGFKMNDNKNGFANAKPIYHIWERKRKSGICEQCEEIDYDGYVGCVGTSTGLVLVRRNHEECISGNTIYNLGWLKHEIYDKWKAGDPDIDVIQFSSILNPAYPKAEFERAKKTMPAWKFNMFYMGEYDIPAGLIYDCFSGEDELESVHLDPNWNRYVFHDFGGVNMAALWIAEQQVKGGKPIFVIYREYLKGGMSIEGHAREFQKLSEGEKTQARIGGGPSEDQYRRDFGNHGWPIQRPPISDVEIGIDRVYGLHRENRIKVLKSCRAYLDEKGSYSRKLDENGDPTEKIQDKESYHLMDCERYGMSYLTQREQSGGGFTVELGDERDMLA